MRSSTKVLLFLLTVAPGFAQADAVVEKVGAVEKKCSAKCLESVYNGFSIGADLIYHLTEVKHQDGGSVINLTNPIPVNGTSPGSDFVKHKRYRFDPAINLGWAYFKKGFYAGLSAEVAFGDKNKRSQAFFVTNLAETKVDGIAYGAKLKLGGYIREIKSIIYGIAGVKWRDIEFQYHITDNNPVVDKLGSKAKLKTPYFVAGAGFERVIRDKWSLTGEYEYSWRNSSDSSTIAVDIGTTTANVSQRLREHSLRIGLKYHI